MRLLDLIAALGRILVEYLPEIIAALGLAGVVVTTWVINPVIGAYVTSGVLIVMAWMVAEARKPRR